MITSAKRSEAISVQTTVLKEVELSFHDDEDYFATDILDELFAFCDENGFTDVVDYLNSEFDIDGVYDVFGESNDNWIQAIDWLRTSAAVFQGYELDFEVRHGHSGERIYVISGEV